MHMYACVCIHDDELYYCTQPSSSSIIHIWVVDGLATGNWSHRKMNGKSHLCRANHFAITKLAAVYGCF